MSEIKTPQQIIDDCNALARTFYGMLGYQVPEGYRFDKAHHPQEKGMWNMAVAAYDHIEGTEVEQILDELEECATCRGYGHFKADGTVSVDGRDRKCSDCRGTGKVG